MNAEKKGEGTKESVILLKGRQDTDQQAAKVINTLNENSFCHQEFLFDYKSLFPRHSLTGDVESPERVS